MAVDEGLLVQAQTSWTLPVLRVYEWNPPAVSLGRFQKREIAVNTDHCKRLGIDIVRRITGGRAVLHHRELTYSIVVRSNNPLFPTDILGTYKVIATCLIAGLNNLGISAAMVSRGGAHAMLVKQQLKDSACFSSPSWYEIMVNGRKIIGSAQRRLSRAFLQHGSILMDYDHRLAAEVISGECSADAVTSITRESGISLPVEEVKRAFIRGFAETLNIQFQC
ncbi:MAG TPA: lipoate--protein ligase family protein [Nitrospirota bacterium]|nr:lipoate--protein ligase family protein [Nitrospirota bacterium]